MLDNIKISKNWKITLKPKKKRVKIKNLKVKQKIRR